MTTADYQESLRIELRSIERDMEGISPKTSLYQKLLAKKEGVLERLEQAGAARTARVK